MYQKILVPLDGSEMAECVLPHVEAVAKGCRVSTVIFLRVVQPFQPFSAGAYVPTAKDIDQIDADNRAEADDYLNQLVSRTKYDGTGIESKVLTGQVAESIADYATKNDIDLIVIATHGRSGISRWVWGSVADRILRSACVPVLMVRAPGCFAGI